MADEAETGISSSDTPAPTAETPSAPQADEPKRLDDLLASEDEQETPATPAEDEFEEFDWNGKKFNAPKGFSKEFTDGTLRQADYTRKSQANADLRRQLQQREQYIAEQAKAIGAELDQRAELTAIRKQLDQYANVNWQEWTASDPMAAQAAMFEYNRLEREAQRLGQSIEQGVARRTAEAQRARHDDLAKRLQETQEFARTTFKDWKPETDKEVVDFALAQGVEMADLQAAMNPTVYKILYFARKGYEVLNKPAVPAAKLQQQQQPPVTPLKTVGGKAAPPSGRPEDITDMEAYVAARKKQMAARSA